MSSISLSIIAKVLVPEVSFSWMPKASAWICCMMVDEERKQYREAGGQDTSDSDH